MNRRRFGAPILLLFLAALAAGCGSAAGDCQKSLVVMDTVATLRAAGPGSREAVAEGLARLKELENMALEDARRLKEGAGQGAFIPLHPEIYHLLETAQQYSRLSEGAFDVTAGPLAELWGIGTDRARVPTPAEIAAAQKLVDWQKLELRTADCSGRLLLSGMSLDLGGIMKGLALDEVRRIYVRCGVKNGLIDLGASSLLALGTREPGRKWRIGIKNPRSSCSGDFWRVVSLDDEALSTSGDYERYFVSDGQRYHHILDPRTGYPAQTGVAAVCLVLPASEDAGLMTDILSTLSFVLGPEAGERFLTSLPYKTQGLFIDEDLGTRSVNGLAERLEQQ